MKKRSEEGKEDKLKGTGIVISPQDILKALNKLDKILPFSRTEELILAKSKGAVEKEKIEQEIEKDVQKVTITAHLNEHVENIKEKILRKPQLTRPFKESIQEIEARIERKEKELVEKRKELEALKNPSSEPLHPSEMVDTLIYSPYHNSLNQVLVDKLEGLIAESAAQKLIDTTNSLISLARIEPLKSKINSRKDFLKTTKEKLPLLTKLPNKPGDEDNIGGFISSMKNLQGAFVAEQEINDQRINFLHKTADLLIALRGYLKISGDPKLMPETGTIDFSKGGIVGFLGPLLSEVEEIVKSVRLLVKDFSLLYNFVEPDQNSPQNLMRLLKNHQKFLYQQKESNHKKFLKAQDFYDLGFVREEDGSVKRKGITLQVERGELRKSGHDDLSKKNSDLLEQYKEVLEEIINSCFNESSLPSKAFDKKY
jgi:hypothetical protein